MKERDDVPTLFISYKRGTSAVAPLMERLRAAHYRLWFDRDEIHLGDANWKARIDQGIERCDGLILNLTPEACASEPVRYEVEQALALGKPIFPIVLEKIENWGEALIQVGLTPDQHTEDFTDVSQWEAHIERLLRDLRAQGLTVTRHELRRKRDPDNPKYVLHQTYLKRLAERVGTLNLAQITPEAAQGMELERVYVDSPTGLSLSVEVQDWQIVDWWISEEKDRAQSRLGVADEKEEIRQKPAALGYETAPFEALIPQIDEQIARYREKYPAAKPDEKYRWLNPWKNGTHENVLPLHLNHLAAARDRLVILGAPGSGKSTFVKYLALCLAGSDIDDWSRDVDITALDNWSHGALTPVYIELRRFVASGHFPAQMDAPATADHLWAYIEHELLGADLREYADDLRYDLEHGHAVLILDGLDEVPYPEGQLQQRQQQLIGLARSLNTRYAASRVIVASRPYAYEGWTLPGFQAVTITAFKNSHREALAERLYRVAGLAEQAALKKARALNQQLRGIDPELKDRPLFVTLMATIYRNGEREGLPTRRGALYRESILLLLDRWTQGKQGLPSLVELLGDKSLDDLYDRLAALAYAVHGQYGEQPGTPEIDEMLLYKHLKPLGRGTAAELIPYLSENAGVLVSPGQDGQKDVFHFAHRTFQEYLAAAHLVEICRQADSFATIRDHICEKPQAWRVPGALAGDVLADTNRRGDLWELLEDLLDDDALNTAEADSPHWWRVRLSATIYMEQRLHQQETRRRSGRAVQDLLRDRLVRLIETPQALEPVERADCGRALGLLGDPRKGVGVIALTPNSPLPTTASQLGEGTSGTYRQQATEAMVHIARELRQRETPAEDILWEALRNRRLAGLKFRRQHPVANTNYVVDFFCYEHQLVVELDGGIHAQQQEADAIRQRELEAQNLCVLRFSNDAVYNQLENVLTTIAQTALEPPLPAPQARSGEGAGGEGLWLPDIDWVTIPAGEFTYQDGKMTLDYDFQISRYPVTYAQFQAFIDDSEGFTDPRWWEGLAIPDGHNDAPGDQAFKYWNHPRERVSWYDAIAFCRWLSWRLDALTPSPSPDRRFAARRGESDASLSAPPASGEAEGFRMRAEIRLPTEFEWERAARGTDGREYPYGNDFDAAKGNTRETGIGQTSAVGIFPNGASPEGVLDMSGNVWEWCLTDYNSPQEQAADEDIRSNSRRVLRGGSWNYDHNLARGASRFSFNPNFRGSDLGFRLVCVRAPSL